MTIRTNAILKLIESCVSDKKNESIQCKHKFPVLILEKLNRKEPNLKKFFWKVLLEIAD
jgi:hypothetical protein